MKIFTVEDYNVLVIGGSGGIGSVICQGFIDSRAKVTIIDKNIPNKTIKNSASFYKCDLNKISEIKFVLNEYLKLKEKIDVLINCAAITIPGEIINYDFEDWDKVININLTSIFLILKIIGKHVINNKGKCSIINVTSIGAEQGFENNPSYAATKGGLKTLTKSLAAEWGKYGIRVNNLVPGYTNTQMNSKSWNDPSLKMERAQNTILGRWAEPAEFIGPAIFLASDASSYVTGSDLVVDGGWLSKGM